MASLKQITAGIFASASALALGACSLEEHPPIEGTCHVIGQNIQVRNNQNEITFVARAPRPEQNGVLEAETVYRWNSEFPYNGEAANERLYEFWIVSKRDENRCELQGNHGAVHRFTGGIAPASSPVAP